MTPQFFYISDITNSSSFNGRICRHIVKDGLDWICKTRTGFVKHGFVKGGLSFFVKMIDHLLQIRVLQIRVLQIRVLQIRVLQIRVLQIHVLQIRVLQIRVLQIRVLQIRVLQIHVLQIRVLQIRLLQIQAVFYKSNPVDVLQYAK